MVKFWREWLSSKKWESTWLFVLTKILTVLAAVPLTFAWKDGNTHRVLLIVCGVVVYLIAFIIDALIKLSERLRKSQTEEQVRDGQSETTRTICHSVSGIPQHTTSFLSQVRAGNAETRPHLDRYFTDVMESLTKTMTGLEPRVCLYMADRAEATEGERENSVSLLLCGNGVGRSDPSRSAFDSATDYGQFVIQRMNERKAIRIEDTDDPPVEFAGMLDCADKYYKTFIAVPVTYNSHEYGMLMIDSPKKHSLTEDHEVIAHLFGRFLGSGVHIVQQSPASLPRPSLPRVSVGNIDEGGV